MQGIICHKNMFYPWGGLAREAEISLIVKVNFLSFIGGALTLKT